ncbi:MAG TPA: exosortase family protein XrtF [Salinimicrobium sp.]|nr:exosortase family protein XrtF [Salinimicrobium sp.]
MRQLLFKYRAVIQFLFTFLGSYLLFALLYHLYLENADSAVYYPDFMTHMVAAQSEAVIATFGYLTHLSPTPNFPAMDIYINGNLVSRIIEGCNSVSIIILFVAFMLAFFGKLKPTLLFIFSGIVIIYAMNIVRIALLSIGIYELPQHAHFLHKIIFPLVIYGTVFILWIIWISIYNKHSKR